MHCSPLHDFYSRKRVIVKDGEKPFGRRIILVGYLIAILVDAATNNAAYSRTSLPLHEPEFPQFFPQNRLLAMLIIHNFQKMLKI